MTTYLTWLDGVAEEDGVPIATAEITPINARRPAEAAKRAAQKLPPMKFPWDAQIVVIRADHLRRRWNRKTNKYWVRFGRSVETVEARP